MRTYHHYRLPADIAADDHIASEDGTLGHSLVDGVRDHPGGHRELDRARVHDADHIAGTGRLEDAEERPVATVLSVEFDDLLVVVGALKKLDPGVQRPAVSLDEDLDAVDRRVEGVGAERTTLDGRRHRVR